jgi:hypothetical protein
MSTLGAVPVTSVAQTNELQSRHRAAQARATWRTANAIGAANEDKAAKTALAAPSSSDGLGSLAIATTVAAMMTSMPAALHSMTQAALSRGSDKPNAASLSISQDTYAQLTRRVASPGGSTGAGMQTGSSSTGQRGDSSSEDARAGDADGAEATQTAGNTAQAQAQFSSTESLAMATADATTHPVVASAVAALAAPTRNTSAPSTHAMQVVEDVAPASASMLTSVVVRQAIAQFKQNVTSIRIPMSVVSLVA